MALYYILQMSNHMSAMAINMQVMFTLPLLLVKSCIGVYAFQGSVTKLSCYCLYFLYISSHLHLQPDHRSPITFLQIVYMMEIVRYRCFSLKYDNAL